MKYPEEEVPCRRCGARAGAYCTTTSLPDPGRPTVPHKPRVHDWIEHQRMLRVGKRRRVVAWTTTEVREWRAVLPVPDAIPEDEIEEYFADGNCPTLIDYETEEHLASATMEDFQRELVTLGPVKEDQ